jgi:hypothetical protein
VRDQVETRAEIVRADEDNLKRGQDIDIADSRFILTDTVTGVRLKFTVASGVATFTAV